MWVYCLCVVPVMFRVWEMCVFLQDVTHKLSHGRLTNTNIALLHHLTPLATSTTSAGQGSTSNNSTYFLSRRIKNTWQSNLTDSHQPAEGGGAQGQKSSSSHGRVSRDSHLSDKQWDCLKMTEDDVLVGEEFQVIEILLIFWVNDSGQKSSLQILQASTIQSWDILNCISTHPRESCLVPSGSVPMLRLRVSHQWILFTSPSGVQGQVVRYSARETARSLLDWKW